mmetsp:Transcript_13676/g.43006  ORF Transcript_13676/g.43006 Transcript_13676/m.43006 type:complete len:279 (-) Transcript_13676:2313-3149(-)
MAIRCCSLSPRQRWPSSSHRHARAHHPLQRRRSPSNVIQTVPLPSASLNDDAGHPRRTPRRRTLARQPLLDVHVAPTRWSAHWPPRCGASRHSTVFSRASRRGCCRRLGRPPSCSSTDLATRHTFALPSDECPLRPTRHSPRRSSVSRTRGALPSATASTGTPPTLASRTTFLTATVRSLAPRWPPASCGTNLRCPTCRRRCYSLRRRWLATRLPSPRRRRTTVQLGLARCCWTSRCTASRCPPPGSTRPCRLRWVRCRHRCPTLRSLPSSAHRRPSS